MTSQTPVNTVWRYISFHCYFCLLHKRCCLEVIVVISCVRRLHFNSWGQPFPQFEGCQPFLSQNTHADGNIRQPYHGAVAAGQICSWVSTMSETVTLSWVHNVRKWPSRKFVQVALHRAQQQHLRRERHPQLSLLLHFQAASSALLYLLLLRAVQRGISLANYPFHLLHLYTRLMLNWGWELPFPSTPECRQRLETAPWWHLPACKSWRREKICWVHVGGKGEEHPSCSAGINTATVFML